MQVKALYGYYYLQNRVASFMCYGLVEQAMRLVSWPSVQHLLITVPFTKTELAKRAFRCSAPSVWNSLPSFITNSGSLTTFKSRRLKTYFFWLSFDCSVHVWPHHIPASTAEVTTLWRYMNQLLLLLLLLLLLRGA